MPTHTQPEMTEKNRISQPVLALIGLVVFAAVALLARWTIYPVLFLGLPLVWILRRTKALWGALYTALTLVLSWLIIGDWWYYAPLLYLPLAAGALIALSPKVRSFTGMMIACGGALAGVGLVVAVFSKVQGEPIVDYFYARTIELIRGNEDLAYFIYAMFNAPAFMKGALTPEEYLNPTAAHVLEVVLSDARLTEIRATVFTYVPMLMCRGAMIAGFVAYLWGRKAGERAGRQVVPMPSFERFAVPRPHGTYITITYFVAYIPSLFNIEKLLMAGDIIFNLISFVLTVQGISFVYWLLHRKIRSKGGAGAITGAICMFLMPLLTWVGLFDNVFRFRERFDKAASQGGNKA